MILNLLLALLSLFADNSDKKEYWEDGFPVNLYDFECDGIYYEFAGEDEVNLVREKTTIILYQWIMHDRSYQYALAYNEPENVCYVGDLVIPDSVAYEGKKYKVASVNTYALSFARGLKSITFTSDIPLRYPTDRAKYPDMENASIRYSRDLTNVTYYDSTTTISCQVHQCPSLRTVHFPYKLDSLYYSFVDCGFTEIDLDNHGEYNPSRFTIEKCFGDSHSLRKIKFPECDTLLLKSTPFLGCNNIEYFVFRPCSVIIQEGYEFLYYEDFEEKKGYAAVVCESVVPPEVILRDPEKKYSFENGHKSNRCLFVPDESVDAYRAAPYWGDFWSIWPISRYYALESVKIESPMTDMENKPEVKLSSDGGDMNVAVSEPMEVAVWSMQGARIWSGYVSDCITLTLPRGMYIIATPGATMKYCH